MKILITVFSTLFVAAIIASAKAIVDVEVLKAENMNIKEHLVDAKADRKIIKANIVKILEKL